MDIKYLTTFQKVAEVGSYQKAAMALNYTQSTITFQMQTLEKEFGVQLFEKVGRSMQLTPIGKKTLLYVNEILNTFQKINALHDTSLKTYSGTLQVALPESILTYKIQPVFEAFRKQAPDVKLSFHALNCYAIQEKLRKNQIDIGVHYDIGHCPSSICTQPLATFPLSLIASPKLSQSDADFKTKHQNKTFPLLINDNDALFLKIFRKYLREQDITLESEHDLWSIEAIKRSVASDMGISFLPTFTIEQELVDKRLVELPIQQEQTMTLLYAYNTNKWISPAMQLFIDLLNEHIQ